MLKRMTSQGSATQHTRSPRLLELKPKSYEALSSPTCCSKRPSRNCHSSVPRQLPRSRYIKFFQLYTGSLAWLLEGLDGEEPLDGIVSFRRAPKRGTPRHLHPERRKLIGPYEFQDESQSPAPPVCLYWGSYGLHHLAIFGTSLKCVGGLLAQGLYCKQAQVKRAYEAVQKRKQPLGLTPWRGAFQGCCSGESRSSKIVKGRAS